MVRDPNTSSVKLSRDLGRVAWWTHHWKISFDPDPSKQAVEVHFCCKINPMETPPVCFNNLAIDSCETHKRLGLLLDKRLTSDRQVEEMILKGNKVIGLRLADVYQEIFC